jgi:xylulokinase
VLLIGIDIGTTSVKGILVDNEGNTLGDASCGHDLISLYSGWAEEEPEVWWNGTLSVLRQLSQLAKGNGRRVAAMAVSGMVPALVLLDSEGRPVRRSIQQNDARAHEEIKFLKSSLNEEEVFKLTGGGINQQTMPPKLLWLEKHEPEALKKAKHILGSYDYITYKLTGRLTLEKNWALESGMFNVRSREWIPHILHSAGITEDMLPPVKAPAEIVGPIRKEVA